LLLAVLGAAAPAVYAGSGANKPNFVIILSDDQGYGDVSYHEHPRGVATPGIDRLAREGRIFTNGYVSAYVCAPSRAGLLTGRYQQRYGFYRCSDSRLGLPLSEITLADLLKGQGYATGVFGKWHLGIKPAYHPLKRGFDEFYGFLGHGAHDYFDLTCKTGREYNCIYRNAETINDSGYLTDNLAREACAFIEKHASRGRPFFLYLAFNAVHWPLQAPEDDIRRFNSGNRNRNVYLAMLYRMDMAVNRVIEALKEKKVYENTLIFYLTDNGGAKRTTADNRPLRGYKHSTYEGGIRVPFIMTWPGHIEPGICDEPVISLDIMPTICDVLGVELPQGRAYDGKSLIPLINGKQKGPLHEFLFWDGGEGFWAVRNGRWKLLKNRKGAIELYDLQEDIGERKDLSRRYPRITARLFKRYQDWRSSMGEPMKKKRDRQIRRSTSP